MYINNLATYAKNYPYIVAKEVDGEWWFWGAYETFDKASQVAYEENGRMFETKTIDNNITAKHINKKFKRLAGDEDLTKLSNLYKKTIDIINNYKNYLLGDVQELESTMIDIAKVFYPELIVNGRFRVGSQGVTYDWIATGEYGKYTGDSYASAEDGVGLYMFAEDLCMAYYRVVMDNERTEYNIRTPQLIDKLR